jgi:glycosyltransferase involved in cell wall biosynthesis
MTRTVNAVYKAGRAINADIYHLHDPELLPIGLLLKLQGKRVIYDAHEDVPRQILSKHWICPSLRRTVARSFEAFEDFVSRRLDVVITATSHIRDRFARIGCKAVDVNNYPKLEEFASLDVTLLDKKKAVCYVGGISDIRGIREMVASIAITEGAQLFLAGKFETDALLREVSGMSGWDKVHYYSVVDRKSVCEILGMSLAGLVVLHPTENYVDSLPIKMFEYMSARIPVIGSNFPLWKEIIERNGCGICVDPLNTKEIAAAVQWIIDHPEKAKIMGENGRRAVEDHYNWESESKKLLAVYNKIAQGL